MRSALAWASTLGFELICVHLHRTVVVPALGDLFCEVTEEKETYGGTALTESRGCRDMNLQRGPRKGLSYSSAPAASSINTALAGHLVVISLLRADPFPLLSVVVGTILIELRSVLGSSP